METQSQQTKKIDELINTAKQAIKDNDVEKAVTTDSALSKYMKASSEAIESQSEIHAHQYDFITKYRVYNFTKEIILTLAVAFTFDIASTLSGIYFYIVSAACGISAWLLVKNVAATAGPMRMFKSEEQSIVKEKKLIQQTYIIMSRIQQYQLETAEDMSRLYQQYEKKYKQEYQGLEALLNNSLKEYTNNKTDDETHS
jgi:hypothetical protein